MDEGNSCFDQHEDLFEPLGSDSDCLKDFILEPPLQAPAGPPPPLPQHHHHHQSIHHHQPHSQLWNNGSLHHYQHPLPVVESVLNIPGLGIPPLHHETPLSHLHRTQVPSYNSTVHQSLHNSGGGIVPMHNSVLPSLHNNVVPHTLHNSVVSGVNSVLPPHSVLSPRGSSSVLSPLGHQHGSSPLSTGLQQHHLHQTLPLMDCQSVPPESEPPPSSYPPPPPVSEMETAPPPVTNGDCWSPAGLVSASPAGFSAPASASERTVSSDCVSSETMCSPSEGTSDSPSAQTSSVKPPPPPPNLSTPPNDETFEQPLKKRGRKKKREEKKRSTQTVATYHSQISPEQNGIILKIRKSMTEVPQKVRKKRKEKDSERADVYVEPEVQSDWGSRMPSLILHKIFQMVTKSEGCVPFLVRVSRVCRLWREVAISPRLWQNVNLASTWVKDRAKNDLKFRWLCENRLALVQDLNIGGWEFDGLPYILDKMASSCTELRGLSLTGWQGLSAENIKFLVTNCTKLQRLDLSSINPEMGNPRSAVSMLSLVGLAQDMGERLTQLTLSDNKLSGIPQILQALSNCCPNLQVLDLSNVRTVSHTTVYLHIEKLQSGCPKLRVFRITNSEFALAAVPLKEQSLSEGFPELEELSVADTASNMSKQPVMDDDSLHRILKTSHKLRLLDVRGCTRVSGNSLVRLPAWDLEHLFLSGCSVTRSLDSGLELILQKWAHSLVEVDLAWSSATQPLDAAVLALANYDGDHESPLRMLNLCGSSVSLEPVKAVLRNCPLLSSLNLSSCRGLPRGIKRLYTGPALSGLRSNMAKEGQQQEGGAASAEQPDESSPQ